MKPAIIKYELKVNYKNQFIYDPVVNGRRSNTVSIRHKSREITRTKEQSQLAWSADFSDEAVGGIDFEARLDNLSGQDKEHERKLLEELFSDFRKSDASFAALNDVVQRYMEQSLLFESHDRLVQYLDKLARSGFVFDAMNNTHTENDAEFLAVFRDAKAELKKIWGAGLKFTDTSKQKLGEEFDGFEDLLDELGKDIPYINFDTPITYALDVIKRPTRAKISQVLFDAARNTAPLSDTIDYKDLPPRLFAIQEKLLGFVPETVGKFRIFLDHISDEDHSYRLTFEGNTMEELLVGIKESAKDRFEEFEPDDHMDTIPSCYRVTIQSYNDQTGVFQQSDVFEDLNDLDKIIAPQLSIPHVASPKDVSPKL